MLPEFKVVVLDVGTFYNITVTWDKRVARTNIRYGGLYENKAKVKRLIARKVNELKQQIKGA
jgi:hypothetical protein